MNRLHKLLLVILAIVFLVWLDEYYAQYKMGKKYEEITYGSAR